MIIRKIENTMVDDVLAVIKCIQVSNNATKVIMISSACMPISIISLRCIVGWLLILLYYMHTLSILTKTFHLT